MTTSDLLIRPMTTDDLPVALSLERAASGLWTERIFTDELNETGSRVYVAAELNQHVVGFCGLMIGYEEGHITNIAVDPEQRRLGIASGLLLHVTRIAIARSLRDMTLEVRVSNDAARKLYQRFGYAPGGIRPKYYADTGEDALILWANDIDTSTYGLRLANIAEQLERT